MQIFLYNLLKLVSLLLCLINTINCRQISYEVNPNCNISKDCTQYMTTNSVNLVHIVSDDKSDSIHYIWSSITGFPPTLVIAKTDPNVNLTVDWKALVNKKSHEKAINFTKEPLNSMALQFTRLFVFNDVKNNGKYDNQTDPTLDIDWHTFMWSNVTISGSDKTKSIELHFTNTSSYNASVSFDLKVDSSDGRDEELPHLAFTDKSVSLKLSVIGLKTDKVLNQSQFNDANRPRLMADILVVNDMKDKSNKKIGFETITSIDDEYTPGVFDRIHLELDTNKESKESDDERKSFIQWKPIAYNSNDKIIANTLDVIPSDPTIANISDFTEYNSRLLEAYFSDPAKQTSHCFSLMFGASDDTKYYNDKKHNSFSLVVGLGSAPEDSLSFLVQMIIVVGFGLPLLVMVASAGYLIYRRIRRRNANDLLLSQSDSR